jgi:hypothetical protein
MAEEDEGIEVEREPQLKDRSKEWCDDEDVSRQCLDIFKDVDRGFQDQWERSNSQLDYWDIYNCTLGSHQFYNGNSKIFAPLVHDAIEARVTRLVNQIFPSSGKHIEVTASEMKPEELLSLLEFYIRKAYLRTKVLPALVRNGDVEGQYNVYVSWVKTKRHVAMRVRRRPSVEGMEAPDGEEFDDIKEEMIVHGRPVVELISDMDTCVLPATADSLESAIDAGGSVTVVRRWSKAKIRKMIREGEIDKEQGQALLKEMSQLEKSGQQPDKRKNLGNAAGIKVGEKSCAVVFETWTNLKIDDEVRLCRVYFGGEERVLSARRNPNWDDKLPILSGALEKLGDLFKGQSKVKFVDTYQYGANDFINEAMDSAAYSLLPIVMTDPVKNPRTSSMVLNVAAIWETDPKSTSFANFPPLWKDGIMIVQGFKDQIFQTLGVNPAMIPQAASGKKTNQAQMATEQQVDILTTANAVTILEADILTPMLQRFVALDHQHRSTAMTVRGFGPMGVKAEMMSIEPVQMDRRFEFRWYGVEQARNAQMMQVKMATLNVLRGLGPQDTPGYEKNLAPIVEQFVEDAWGPRLAPLIFTDIRKKMTLEVDFENMMLEAGWHLAVHPMDDDAQHMQSHFQVLQATGDPHGTVREHLVAHQMQMQQKQQAMMMQQQAMLQGQPGMPGGAGPGVAGTPRQGAVPAGPRSQGSPGQIHRDRMPMGMPRAARG